MYEDFFGLKEAPFSIAPNPLYLYMSQQHHEALAHLVYGVGRGGGFVLLTGEVGTGKTTICRCFLQQVPADTDVAFILNPKLNAEQLLATICDELDISYIADDITIKELVDAINHYLLQSHARGRHTVLIIDEAQNLSTDVLEQLRLLTNLETNEKKLLQIVLLGQPELQEMFRQPELRQLAQRITARFHLRELQANEVGPYVRHRLGVAGGRDIQDIFPERTLRRLFQISSGIPRLINVICDRALLGAYAHNRRSVDTTLLESAAREVLGQWQVASEGRSRRLAAMVFSAGVLAASLAWAATFRFSAGRAEDSPRDSIDHLSTEQTQDAAAVHTPGDSASSTTTSAAVVDEPPDISTTPLLPANVAAPEQTGVVSGSPPSVPSSGSVDPESPTPSASQDLKGLPAALNVFGDDALDALAELAALQSIPFERGDTVDSTCQGLRRQSVGCFQRTAGLGYVVRVGLPVMVELDSGDAAPRFAVLTSVHSDSVELLSSGASHTVPIGTFSLAWQGHFTSLWTLPKHYRGVLSPGASSPVVGWLRDSMARLGGEPALGNTRSGDVYSPDLVEAVKRFQRSRGEADDGILGETTVFRMVRELEQRALAEEDAT